MPRIIERADIPLTVKEWQVKLGPCNCGWYRFYHAGCGHLYVSWKHCCAKKKTIPTQVPRFCYRPAPITTVHMFKINGLCHDCIDPTLLVKNEWYVFPGLTTPHIAPTAEPSLTTRFP